MKEAVVRIKEQLGQVIVGQEEFIELLLVSLLADGHVLIEGVPGVAKTVTAKLLVSNCGLTLKAQSVLTPTQLAPMLMSSTASLLVVTVLPAVSS